jgi:hypothetical protein
MWMTRTLPGAGVRRDKGNGAGKASQPSSRRRSKLRVIKGGISACRGLEAQTQINLPDRAPFADRIIGSATAVVRIDWENLVQGPKTSIDAAVELLQTLIDMYGLTTYDDIMIAVSGTAARQWAFALPSSVALRVRNGKDGADSLLVEYTDTSDKAIASHPTLVVMSDDHYFDNLVRLRARTVKVGNKGREVTGRVFYLGYHTHVVERRKQLRDTAGYDSSRSIFVAQLRPGGHKARRRAMVEYARAA